MKIICTQDEKIFLIETLRNSDICIVDTENCLLESEDVRDTDCCIECIRDYIEWELVD